MGKHLQTGSLKTINGETLVGSGDCNGGNCWKISIPINNNDIIFDLREQNLFEILQNSSVVNGIIQCPLAIADRNEFVMFDGKIYKKYLEKQENKKLPKIPNKDLIIGTEYESLGANTYPSKKVFLGKHKFDNKNMFCFATLSTKNDKPLHFWYFYKTSSPNFKSVGDHYDNYIEMVEESIKQNNDEMELRNKKYQEELKKYEQAR